MNSVDKLSCLPGMRLAALLCLVAGLAACGGGGSSGGGGVDTHGVTLPTAPVTITSSNQNAVAGAAVDTAISGTSLPMGVQVSAAESTAVSSTQKLGKIGQASVQRFAAQKTAAATVTGIVQTIPCAVSGDMSYDIAATGTSATVTFNNCVDVAGETMSGTLTMSNIVNTATSTAVTLNFNLTLVTASPANTFVAKGDMRVVQNYDAMSNPTTSIISGSSLAMSNTDPALGNWGLQNYSITTDASGNVTAMTYTFASTAINGTATLTMTSQFTYGAGIFPNSGVATITGANSTKLKITVLGDEYAAVGSQVKLELSIDGGTTYGTPSYVNWAALSSEI